MSDIDKSIGEKIRILRLKKQITQKDLAGDRISRNMLSLIECGSASPSVSTLTYLAARLETPTGYFFVNTMDDEAVYSKLSVIKAVKEAFRRGAYEECEEMAESVPSEAADDEISFILAKSWLRTSCSKAAEGRTYDALNDLDNADEYAARSIYCSETFAAALMFYRTLFTTVCSEEIHDVLADFSAVGEDVPVTLVQYFAALKAAYSDRYYSYQPPKGSFFEKHIAALSLLREGHDNEARKRLRELVLSPELPYYMQYRVLCDLEKASENSGDIRTAYSASRRRLEVLEHYRRDSEPVNLKK